MPDTDPYAALRDTIIAALRTVYDPEIPVNLYDLGLIYRLAAEPAEDGKTYDVVIDMTLTTPNCPVAEEIPANVHRAVAELPAIHSVKVNLVWDPPWDKASMSDEAKLQLNMF